MREGPDVFTETHYRMILHLIKQTHRFEYFTNIDIERNFPTVLWRHDIDMSPQNAAQLAAIENEENIHATYFIHLHSVFYNPLDDYSVNHINSIIDHGHPIGLHHDPDFYKRNTRISNPFEQTVIAIESDMLWDTFGRKPMAISFHNPSLLDVAIPDALEIEGMINTNSKILRENYHYYSDSNHIWNPKIVTDQHPRLHVLTHPEWWSEQPMAHMAKVSHIIADRMVYEERYYDNILRRVHDK